MKVLRDDLMNAAKAAKLATDAVKSVMEAHKCFQLSIVNGNLCISACGPSQIYADVMVSAEDTAEWNPVLVYADVFTSLLSKIEGLDILEIVQEKEDPVKSILIKGKGTKLVLNTVQTDFPQKEAWEESLFDGKVTCLSEVRQVIHAVASDSAAAPTLRNVHFIIGKDGGFLVECLDGHRISRRMQEYNPDNKVEFLVDGELVNRIIKMIPDKECTLKVDTKKCAFITESAYIQCPASNAPYFDVNRMIALDRTTTEVVFNREELLANVELASIYSDAVSFDIKDNSCAISNQLSSFGTTDLRPSCTVRGNDVKFYMDPKLLIEGVKTLPSDDVKICVENAKSPVYFGEESHLELILPVSVHEG